MDILIGHCSKYYVALVNVALVRNACLRPCLNFYFNTYV